MDPAHTHNFNFIKEFNLNISQTRSVFVWFMQTDLVACISQLMTDLS